MPLALASAWRAAVAGVSLLALTACATDGDTDAAPATAPIVDRTDRVTNELARGQQALSSGDLSTAQAAFTAALRGSPNDPEPALGLAETYLALGDLQTAGKLFDLVESNTSGADEGRLLQGRGLVALGQGSTDEAIRLLERSVERSPGLWRAWAGLGRAYGRQGRSNQARDAFARAEDAAPVRALVINDIGMLHIEENDPGAALEAFQRALTVDPGNVTANANARIARAMLGDYDAAISGARPDELPDVLNNVGYIAIVNGDFDVADRLLRRAIEISPVYHEAASANLDLLGQAMKGVPVLAVAERGSASSKDTDDTELSSGPGDVPKADGLSAAHSDGVIELMAETASPTAPQGPPQDAPGELRAIGVASDSEEPAASQMTLAHGFRWDAPPVSAKNKPKRKRRSAQSPAAGSPDGDPRTAAVWPTITLPTGTAPGGSGSSTPDAIDAATASPAEVGSLAASPDPDSARPGATPAEGTDSQSVESSAALRGTAPDAADIGAQPGLPE